MDLVSLLTPEGLALWMALLLIGVAALTSAMTAAFGIGGGLVLLVVMIPLVPIQALIPVHGVVQLGSNTGRAIIQARFVRYDVLTWFILGAIGGGIIGSYIVVEVPTVVLKLSIGAFVLWSIWGKMPAIGTGNRILIAIGGAICTLLSLFVGATGPFVMALYAHTKFTKEELVATFAGSMLTQHVLKIIVFGALGFAFAEWLPLAVAMIAAGFIGTVLGTRVLRRLPERVFRVTLKVLMTAMGLELVITSIGALAGW